MIIKAIRTRKFLPPKDDLWEFLSENIKTLKEDSVVAVTSKVVSIGEGRCIPLEKYKTKDELAIKEADKYLPRDLAPHGLVMHTIKNNMMIASAGIDESNALDHYILWPKDPYLSAEKIWKFLKNKFKLKNLGVIITDSRLVPLRRGVVGIAISFFGFKPLKDYRGKRDIFGREFKMETSNLPDSLATAAILEMGEGNEQSPIAIITELPYLEFTNHLPSDLPSDYSFTIPEKEDIFYPLLSSVKWKKGGGGKIQ